MGKLNLNNWYVKDNTLSIELKDFIVDINVINEENKILVRVEDKLNNEVELDFDTLGEAIFYTENIINASKSNEEIELEYKKMFNKKEDKSIKIDLTPNEVDQAILEYFDTQNDYNVRVEEELSIIDNHPDIKFYLKEYIDYMDIKKEIKTLVSEEELKKALNEYISIYNYELLNFKYIGGIHRVGYFFDEDKPYYDGIQLNVKKKTKILTKK